MSLSSKKTRRQLRNNWIKLVGAERDVSFQVYKERLSILPKMQRGWSPRSGRQAPHEQGQTSA